MIHKFMSGTYCTYEITKLNLIAKNSYIKIIQIFYYKLWSLSQYLCREVLILFW